MLTRALCRSLGRGGGAPPGGGRVRAPSPRRAKLLRRPCLPVPPTAPHRRSPGARPAAPGAACVPCQPDGLPRPAARPGLPPLAAALPTPLRAPRGPAEGPPLPAPALSLAPGVSALRDPRGPGREGCGPGGVAHAAACRGRRSQCWELTQAPFDPPLDLPLSQLRRQSLLVSPGELR